MPSRSNVWPHENYDTQRCPETWIETTLLFIVIGIETDRFDEMVYIHECDIHQQRRVFTHVKFLYVVQHKATSVLRNKYASTQS